MARSLVEKQGESKPLDSRLRKSKVRASLFKRKPELIQIGRFSLLELLGSGRMGDVYAAYDQRLDRKVAIKLVRGHFDGHEVADRRLLREAQTLAQLSHPNVVQVYDAGIFEGRVFIAMEFVRGRTMTRWLDTLEGMPRRTRDRLIFDQFVAAGRGLLAAHDAGLTHRDFKPDNIVVGDDGRTRVVDFGLARVQGMAMERSARPALESVPATASTVPADDKTQLVTASTLPEDVRPAPASTRSSGTAIQQASVSAQSSGTAWLAIASTQPTVASDAATDTFHTPRGALVGTPAYMAPEVLSGEDASYRSDQFSFCVSLFEALHGARPFAGHDIATLEKNIRERGVPASAFHPAVPAPVRRVLMRGLSAEPSDRFPDMRALLHELEEWPRRRRRLWRALATLVALALVAVFVGSRSRGPSPEESCAIEARDHVADIWNPERAEALSRALLAEDGAYAHEAWERRIRPKLETYTASLEDGYLEQCRSAHYEQQSEELLLERSRCLDESRASLSATIELSQDAAVAVQLLDQLPPLAECSQPSALRATPDAPASEATRQEVGRLSQELRRTEVLVHAGRFAEARAAAHDIAALAEKRDYADILARALLLEGWGMFKESSSSDATRVLASLERATTLALERQVYVVAIEAFARQVYVGVSADGDSQTVLARAALFEPMAQGLAMARSAHLLLLNNLGTLYMARGDRDAARDYFTRTITELDRYPGISNRVELSSARLNLAMLTHDPDEREQIMAHVVALYEERYGAEHPESLMRRSFSSHFIMNPGRAFEVLVPACQGYRVYHRESHAPRLLACLFHQAFLAMELGRPADAAAALEDTPTESTNQVPRAMVEGYRALLAHDFARARERFASMDTASDQDSDAMWRRWPRACTQLGLGLSEQGLGEHRAAIEHFERAAGDFTELVRSNPNNMEYQRRLTWVEYSLARSLWPIPDQPPGADAARARELMVEADGWYRRAGAGYQDRLQTIATWRRERGLDDTP